MRAIIVSLISLVFGACGDNVSLPQPDAPAETVDAPPIELPGCSMYPACSTGIVICQVIDGVPVSLCDPDGDGPQHAGYCRCDFGGAQ